MLLYDEMCDLWNTLARWQDIRFYNVLHKPLSSFFVFLPPSTQSRAVMAGWSTHLKHVPMLRQSQVCHHLEEFSYLSMVKEKRMPPEGI